MKTRKTWREKMNNPKLPKLVRIPPAMQKRFGKGQMLVPSPAEVEAFIQGVPEGSVSTVSQMRQFLAEKHSANVTCPLTTGIFVRIAAEAAEEDSRAGKSKITPYWRVVKDDGALNPKLPGGTLRQAKRLRAEGHQIIPAKTKRPPRVKLSSLTHV